MTKHILPKGPVTPLMRRFLRDVFRPTVALGKRRARDDERENLAPEPWTPTKPAGHCVALQNEDTDEDAVVITALSAVPFCCHADLLTMARPALVAAADAMNARLPHALHIDTGAAQPDAGIRAAIEQRVGIRAAVPRAPKRARSHSLDVSYDDGAEASTARTVCPPSPVSPLAARNRSNASAASRSMLAWLREESDEERPADRPSKRRRTADPRETTPTRPAARPRARRSEPLAPLPVRAAHKLDRSQSHRLPDRAFADAHRNVTVARPGRRARAQSAVLTSTPRVRRWVPKAGRAEGAAADDSFGSPSSVISAATTASCDSPSRMERVSGWLEGRAGREVEGVTAELEGLSLGLSTEGSSSDMDISY
ncbi:hypothetical protein PsYK624_152870 [Phanerochaete sordida]|uniref:Uncharacterized protein n=1 Tax=Phanerochaete sordida TaxID=48140 RepID=A0A9P3GP02_9APHY|nr:hypothetical protein PsYK624_152870 [Phanerochaete sordida]